MASNQLYEDINQIKQNEHERRKQEAENLARLKQEREREKHAQQPPKDENKLKLTKYATLVDQKSSQVHESQHQHLHNHEVGQNTADDNKATPKAISAQSKRSNSNKSDINAYNTLQTLKDNEDEMQRKEKALQRRLQWLKDQESKKYRQIIQKQQEKAKQQKMEAEHRQKMEELEEKRRQRELKRQQEKQIENEYKQKLLRQKEQKDQQKQEQINDQILRQQKLFEQKLTAPPKNPLDDALINYKPQNIDFQGTKMLNHLNINDKTTYDKETQQIRLEDVDIDALINLDGYKKLKMELEQQKREGTQTEKARNKEKESRAKSPLLAYSPFREPVKPPKPTKVTETIDDKLERIKDKQKQYRIQNVLNWKKNDTSGQMPVNRVINGKQTKLTEEEIEILKDQKKLLRFVGAAPPGLREPSTLDEMKKVLRAKEERAQTMATFLRATDTTCPAMEPPRPQTIAPLQIPPDPRKSPVKQVTAITLKAVADGGIAPRVVCPGRASRGSKEMVRNINTKIINPLPTYISYKYMQNVEETHQKNCAQLLETKQQQIEAERKERQTLQLEQLNYKTVSFEELASQQNSQLISQHESQQDEGEINENYETLKTLNVNNQGENKLEADVDVAVSENSISIVAESKRGVDNKKMKVKQEPDLPTIQQQREIDSDKDE